ncbi:hypothetical protein L6164_028454 [Bauhinia variegata]|uniref:Uncharacterized protein n=1 Tax=Bauhinia variegata TaxID=167791 RepID=A0ACB9L5L2_BAUVA|nr:hypothetical protein L6164_028454 [Bauhinia variegata]
MFSSSSNMGGGVFHEEPSQWSSGGDLSSTIKNKAAISLPQTCGHKEAKLLTSKSEWNLKKKLWRCPHYLTDVDCYFFQWDDEATCERCKKWQG